MSLVNRARKTGNLVPVRRGDGRSGGQNQLQVHEEEAILDSAFVKPSIGIWGLAAMHNRSYTTVQQVLKRNDLHVYHFLRVQGLQPEDYPRRLAFCNWFPGQNANDPEFVDTVLYTDKCTFTRDGTFISKNWHQYAYENPHAILPTRNSQNRFSVNLWCGVVGDYDVSFNFITLEQIKV